MSISPKDIAAAIDRIDAHMVTAKDVLNAADARLGDGDTGGMLARLVGAFAATPVAAQADVGEAILALAKAGAISTGSSFGTLIVGALMAVGKRYRGQAHIEWREVQNVVAEARDAMMARGKTALGSKTAIDSLDYLQKSLDCATNSADAGARALSATEHALADFRNRQNQMGRARMYAEKSAGLDDPGMLAVHEIVRAIVSVPQPNAG